MAEPGPDEQRDPGIRGQAVLDYHAPAPDPVPRDRGRAHALLAGTAILYLLLNGVLVVLCHEGVIYPPWGVLGFFGFWGPLLLTGSVVAVQADGRPFRWAAVLLFVAVLAGAAAVNLYVLMWASASV